MNGLAALLARLQAEGFRLELRGESIAVIPKARLTEELAHAILHYRADIIELLRLHHDGLLQLFADAPGWPPSVGRSGSLAADWWHAVGNPVRMRDGREGPLRFLAYDTRSGRVRLRVDFPNGWALVDPEDVSRNLEERRSA